MLKLSIIIPVYNVEKYIKECLDSIKNQTFTDFEVLLVDDGSPDNSGAICDEYAAMDSRFKVFHKPNGGVSSARNLGLDNANGEWVTFIDPDDYIISNEAYKEVLGEAIGCNCDLIHFGFTRGKGNVYPSHRGINKTFLNRDDILKTFFLFNNIWSVLFKRKVLGSHRFVIMKTGQDSLFIQSCLLEKNVNSILIINKAFIFYRENSSSVTSLLQQTFFDDRLRQISILRQIIKDRKLKIDERNFQKKIIRYFFLGVTEYSKFKNVGDLAETMKEFAPKFHMCQILTWNIVFQNKRPNISYLLVKLKLYKQAASYIKRRLNN